MDCSIGGNCNCFDFCNSTALITPSQEWKYLPRALIFVFCSDPTLSPTVFIETTNGFASPNPTVSTTQTVNSELIDLSEHILTTQFYPESTEFVETESAKPIATSAHIVESESVKLTTQEVGDGYFHILFSCVYAVFGGFVIFHLNKHKFKLFVPCSIPKLHSKRMAVIFGYFLLLMAATFGFLLNLYLCNAALIGSELIFFYFMSLSLFCCHTLTALSLFVCWIHFDFSKIISMKRLKRIYAAIRCVVLLTIAIMVALHTVMHSLSVPLEVAEVTLGLLSFIPMLIYLYIIYLWFLRIYCEGKKFVPASSYLHTKYP